MQLLCFMTSQKRLFRHITSQKDFPGRCVFIQRELKYLSLCTKRRKYNRSFAQNNQSREKLKYSKQLSKAPVVLAAQST